MNETPFFHFHKFTKFYGFYEKSFRFFFGEKLGTVCKRTHFQIKFIPYYFERITFESLPKMQFILVNKLNYTFFAQRIRALISNAKCSACFSQINLYYNLVCVCVCMCLCESSLSYSLC